MLVVKGDEVKADQVKVVASEDVEVAASDGWRILALLESRHFSSSFVMGRDSPEYALAARAADAERRAGNAAGEMTKLLLEVKELTEAGARAGVAATKAQNEAIELRARLHKLVDEVGKVRKEIGEARWREILGSLEVEQILEHRTVGSDVPF